MAKTNKQITTVTQIDRLIKQAIKTGKQVICPLAGYKGLELRIRLTGDKGATADFRHRYTHPYTGKRPYMTLGQYPAFTLEQARQAHIDNMRLLAQNIDPISHREKQHTQQATAITHTFKAVAKDWLDEQTSNPKHAPSQKTLDNWCSYLEPLNNAFGNYPISEVTTQQILAVCRRIQKKHIHKGNRVKGIASRVFAHAIVNGLIEVNPVLQLTGAKVLKSNKANHHPALTIPAEFAELLKEIDQLNQPNNYNKEVLQLLALTFARIGDVCSMKWCDIDWQAKQWIFEPMKGREREDMVDSLVIPLSPQTMNILQRMHSLTGGHDYVFYNARRKKACYIDPTRINTILNDPNMNQAGIGKDYCGQGYKNVHSPHGFRASAKTLLMERLGYSHLLTELQSGRQIPDQYGNTYNRMEAIAERTEMMNKWANYLDDLKAGKIDNIIHTSFKQAQSKQG